MKNVYNHMIFLSEDARNDLHEGREIVGEGFVTIINQNKKNIDFSVVQELAARYRINSNSNKSEVVIKTKLSEDLDNDDYVLLNFNATKLKVNMDDILNMDNSGKEKLTFTIKEKNSTSHICIADIKTLVNNYVFMDEISNFSEQEKT
jgi:hypothetical protein